MEEKQLPLRVNPELTFNVNTQIREQLKCLIGIGLIRTGDMLPAASQLADQLGMNRNTVNWVYNQLREEGLVTMSKGRGTQVTAQANRLYKEQASLFDLIKQTIDQAEAKELDLRQFFTTGLAYTLLLHPSSSAQARIVLIECKGHDHPFYRKAIERETGEKVETAFLEDLQEKNELCSQLAQQYHVIVTTLNHAEEVKTCFSRFNSRILVIGATVETSFLLDLAKLKQNTRVAFVCLGQAGGSWMANRVREAGLEQIRSETLGWEESGRPSDSLAKWDRIYASAAVYPELKKLAPNKVELYPMKLEASSENLLHELPGSQAGLD
ncbi:GntR family transcriptional regulator [Alkalihalobacillus oceani]|uniref:GntR family transcriptional regulator n=1 Tax=Halalkalibacter oceani TaxID=1653776 RepID=A0A9X2IQJ6_9BACI|nr:GntR family transcriptional regulator [Halalkalibacter oceani]